jgi:arylsulfatase A-like enzyme
MKRLEIIRLSLLAVFLILHFSCGGPQRPNILIITVDTLRADYLGTYGDSTARTPNIDALARNATVFERAAAPMPLTRPSHFSLLTAKYPREHGVVNNAMSLPDEATTITEILQEKGYDTAAFLSVRLLDDSSGAAQGFSTYDTPAEGDERSAEDTISHVLRWLEERENQRPFFLWVHLFDPHIPYAPPHEFRPPEVADSPAVTWPRLNAIAAENDDDIPAEVLEEAKQLYRGEIAYTDHWVGKLLNGVDALWQPENTLIVFAADHGECFENGSYFEHSDCLYEPAIRIPLIVRWEPAFPQGSRIDSQTSIIDIAPTILRAANIEIPSDFSGRALQETTNDKTRYVLIQHPLYQEKLTRVRPHRRRNIRSVAGEPRGEMLIDKERVGVVGGDWKYLRSGTDERLYRITPDVDERMNLAEVKPEARAKMLDQLRRELAQHPLQLIAPSEINDELLKTLEALGYLDH